MKKFEKLHPTEDLDCSYEYERVWDRYDINIRFGVYWRNRASDLNAAAVLLGNVCEKDSPVNVSPEVLGLGSGFAFGAALPPIFRLNAGLAIELLLKACIVKRDGHCENLKPIHQLNKIAKDAGFVVTDPQRRLLDVMTEYVYWLGRYPAPKSREQFESTRKILDGQRVKSPSGFGTVGDPEAWLNLENYQKLWAEIMAYYESIPARRDGDS
tara:strand:- start:54661 stop:55296 length:636 start_codon:yes stop_codon:yes gene_type:complete